MFDLWFKIHVLKNATTAYFNVKEFRETQKGRSRLIL